MTVTKSVNKSVTKSVTKLEPRLKGRRCPICHGPALQKFRPFCSAKCADADLGAWLGGRYRVPASEPPDADEIEELAKALSDDGDEGEDDDGGGGDGPPWN